MHHWICDVELLARVSSSIAGFREVFFYILMILEVIRSASCLNLPLESTSLELNLTKSSMVCCRATRVHLKH